MPLVTRAKTQSNKQIYLYPPQKNPRMPTYTNYKNSIQFWFLLISQNESKTNKPTNKKETFEMFSKCQENEKLLNSNVKSDRKLE